MIVTTGIVLGVLAGCAQNPAPSSSGQNSSSAFSGSCGSPKSCEDLGIRYITGDGVRLDGNKAVAYLAKACNAGRASACNSAAFIYADAEGGVKQSYTQALRYWKRGCRLGDQPSCANVDLAYDKLRKAGY
ncbi:tetratricopeptide repeat protein [Nitratifractor sp.]